MKKQLTLLLFIVLGSMVYAQDTIPKPKATATTSVATVATPSSKKGLGFGLNLSTNGIGGQLAYSFFKSGKLMLRLEGRYLAYQQKKIKYNVSGANLLIDGKAEIGSVGAMVDYHPFSKSSFKLVVGYAMLLNQINGLAYTTDYYKLNDIIISPEVIGGFDLGININQGAYLGLGFGRAVPKKRFGMSLEVGAYYIGKPTVTFKASGMLAPSTSQESVIGNNMSGYNWLPMLNIGLNFRLGKIN
jgi:hypothetical protein